MIKKDSIDKLLEQTDIVDVVSNYVNLKNSGKNFVGLCPFHDDKNPSMSVSSQLGIFHCFSCKAGGNAIKFIMDYEKLNFIEAVEKLASMQNFTLEYSDEKNTFTEDKKILDILNSYYKSNLYKNNNAIKYLYDRGFDDDLIAKFELGWAPFSQNTINLLQNENISIEDALDVGIVKKNENGIYASFIERITFPIRNHSGKLVGFGGRTISNHPAKYVNSPQSRVFDKSKIFYAYDKAKDAVFKQKEILITEGYMDTIMLHKAGYLNTVAVLGTALTQKHLPLLRRSGAKITLCFDGDDAGINAALKSSQLLIQNELDTNVVIIPNGADPADLVQSKKIKELEKILNSKIEAGEFVIKSIIDSFDLSRPVQKSHALFEVQKFTNSLKPIVAFSYQNLVSRLLNIPNQSFKLSNLSIKSDLEFKQANSNSPKKKDYLELQILKTFLLNSDFFDKSKNIIKKENFLTHQDEFEALINLNKSDDQKAILRELNIDQSIDTLKDFASLYEALKRLIIKNYEKQIYELKNSNLQDKFIKIAKIQMAIRKLKGVR